MKHPVSINNSDNLALTTLLCDCFTSVQTMDYGPLDVVLIFEACETRKCVNVSILDDFVEEPEEFFNQI